LAYRFCVKFSKNLKIRKMKRSAAVLNSIKLVESQAGTPVPTSQPMFSRAHAPSTAIPGNGLRRLVRYSYSIAGVTYETAQDVTGLEERLCLERIASGQPASVKYDPSNPSNSILVADDWSGLH
jgi:hypothetical protein